MKKNRSVSEKGQSLVELAIILVLVLILLAGVVDLGRMMFEYLSIRDAAQEAAGYGAVYPNYCAEIRNRANQTYPYINGTVSVFVDGDYCAQAWADDSALDAEGNKQLPIRGCEGNEIIVRINHNSPVSMPLIGVFIDPENDGIEMSIEIKDRIVRPKCRAAAGT